ncbi:frataxin [Nematocida sp. AWRm77]|nr:frataxin [Nematocida sp. AWRm77]
MSLPVTTYNALSKSVLSQAFSLLDGLDGCATLKDGVVTADVKGKGVYVVNRQPPKKEIWLSSPVSGPYHFQYRDAVWKDGRNNELFSLLRKELGDTLE